MSLIYPNPPAAAASGLTVNTFVANPVRSLGSDNQAGSTLIGIGDGALTGVGTVGAPNYNTATKYQMTVRSEQVTFAAGTQIGFEMCNPNFPNNTFNFCRTAGFAIGGRFGFQVVNPVTQSCLFGLNLPIPAGTFIFNPDVSTSANNTDILGIGSDPGDLTFFAITRIAAGLATKVDTTVPIAVNTLYEVLLNCAPSGNATWTIRTIGFNGVLTEFSGTFGGQPLATTRMGLIVQARDTTTAVSAIGLASLGYNEI
jgi:hypothetical protein